MIELSYRLKELEESMGKKFTAELDSKLAPIQKRQAETGVEIQEIRGEMARLAGAVDENRRLVKDVVERDFSELNEMRSSISELERATRHIQSHLGLEPHAAAHGKGIIRRPIEQHRSRVVSEQAVPSGLDDYEKAVAEFRQGNFNEALVSFTRFTESHPESELTDDAQFRIGECYMRLRQYEKAILAFHEYITKSPEQIRTPEAMLQQAHAFHEMQDDLSSKILLKDIIERFPGSDEAQTAKERLEEFESEL
jgi:tol-pal system protein YbgF